MTARKAPHLNRGVRGSRSLSRLSPTDRNRVSSTRDPSSNQRPSTRRECLFQHRLVVRCPLSCRCLFDLLVERLIRPQKQRHSPSKAASSSLTQLSHQQVIHLSELTVPFDCVITNADHYSAHTIVWPRLALSFRCTLTRAFNRCSPALLEWVNHVNNWRDSLSLGTTVPRYHRSRGNATDKTLSPSLLYSSPGHVLSPREQASSFLHRMAAQWCKR